MCTKQPHKGMWLLLRGSWFACMALETGKCKLLHAKCIPEDLDLKYRIASEHQYQCCLTFWQACKISHMHGMQPPMGALAAGKSPKMHAMGIPAAGSMSPRITKFLHAGDIVWDCRRHELEWIDKYLAQRSHKASKARRRGHSRDTVDEVLKSYSDTHTTQHQASSYRRQGSLGHTSYPGPDDTTETGTGTEPGSSSESEWEEYYDASEPRPDQRLAAPCSPPHRPSLLDPPELSSNLLPYSCQPMPTCQF